MIKKKTLYFMAKKTRDEDDFEDEMDDNLNEIVEDQSDEDDADDDSDDEKSGVSLDDDDDVDIDILIEIDEDDLELLDKEEEKKPVKAIEIPSGWTVEDVNKALSLISTTPIPLQEIYDGTAWKLLQKF
jgi:hypothetical protein